MDLDSVSSLDYQCDDAVLTEKKSSKPEPSECLPPDYLLPGCKDRPLVPLHPVHKELKVPQCIMRICCSLNCDQHL